MNALCRISLIVGMLVWVILQARPEWAQSRSSQSVVRFGLSATVVESDVNPNDALAAAKVWADLLGNGTGLWTSAEARIYPDAGSLAAAVNNGDADVVALGTDEYLEIEKNFRAIPSFTYVMAGEVEIQYLILVRNDSGIKTLGDLRNRRIAIPKGGRSSMVPLWIDGLLYDNNLPEKEVFFKELKQVQKTNQAILPIFFKQMDAGIAIKSTYETAVALNPQIGRQLRVLTASPKLVMLVTCIRSTLSTQQRQQYVKQALKLHESPGGLQGFHLFKMDRLVAWDPAYANNVRELLRKKKLAQSASAMHAHPNDHAEAGVQK
jgi:ABC-type phosphate/phosphonate transport system substrate-binding protein